MSGIETSKWWISLHWWLTNELTLLSSRTTTILELFNWLWHLEQKVESWEGHLGWDGKFTHGIGRRAGGAPLLILEQGGSRKVSSKQYLRTFNLAAVCKGRRGKKLEPLRPVKHTHFTLVHAWNDGGSWNEGNDQWTKISKEKPKWNSAY